MESSNFISRFFNYFSAPGTESSDLAKRKEDLYKSHKEKFMENTSRNMPSQTLPMDSKAKALHDSHKLSPKEENWFNIGDTSCFHYPQWHNVYSNPNISGQLKTTKALPSSQSVFNINRGCFENHPITVAENSISDYNHFAMNYPFTTTNPPATQDSSYEEGNLEYYEMETEETSPFGSIYQNLMSFVEISIVESVCHRSRLEYNHQNRLAAEILAASSLNPNAKEFTPKTSSDEDNKDTLVKETLNDFYKIPQVDGIDELIIDNESGSFDQDVKNANSEKYDETLCNRKLVDEVTYPQKRIASGALLRCDTMCVDDETTDEDEDDSDDDGYDDWDWDSDEDHADVQCVDLTEFEDLFQVNLLVTNLGSCHTTQSSPPSSNPRLREINRKFTKAYPNHCCEKTGVGMVKFSDNPVIILEPENLAEDLQNARLSDFKERQADRERMERLLGPILTPTHRQNIYRKIYGENS